MFIRNIMPQIFEEGRGGRSLLHAKARAAKHEWSRGDAIDIDGKPEGRGSGSERVKPLLPLRSRYGLFIEHCSRRRFAHFKLGAHFLDLRCLLFKTRGEVRNGCSKILL